MRCNRRLDEAAARKATPATDPVREAARKVVEARTAYEAATDAWLANTNDGAKMRVMSGAGDALEYAMQALCAAVGEV